MTEESQEKRQVARVPIATKVHLEFEKFSGFITEYSANISMGGMFIKMKEPKPVGTIVSFEFKLTDNFKLIQGLGEAVWVRDQNISDERPAGMGIRFQELDSQSRELIRTMVDNYIKRGGEPFKLEKGESAASPPADGSKIEIDAADNINALFEFPQEGNNQTASTDPERKASEDGKTSEKGSVEKDFQALFSVEDSNAPGSITETPPTIDGPKKRSPLDESMVSLGLIEDESATDSESKGASKTLQIEAVQEKVEKKARAGSSFRSGVFVILFFGSIGIGGGWAYFFKDQIQNFVSEKFGIEIFSNTKVAKVERSQTPSKTTSSQTSTAPQSESSAPADPKTETPSPELSPPDEVAQAEATSTDLLQTKPAPVEKTSSAPEAIPEKPKRTIATGTRKGEFSHINKITWQRRPDGMIFTLWANAPFPNGSYRHVSLRKGRPREVIKIIGVQKPLRNPQFPVNTPEVSRVRTGFHQQNGKSELHVVIDLNDPRVKAKKIAAVGSKLLIHLSK